MRRRRHLLWIALLALTVAAPPALAKRAGKKKTKKKPVAEEVQETPVALAAALAERARAALDAGEFEPALTLAQQALEHDPGNARAMRVAGRVYLEVGISLLQQGDPRAQDLMIHGITHLQLALEAEPTGPEADEVRELLAFLSGDGLLPDPTVECPPEAGAALAEAEDHFGRNELDQAAAKYEEALAGCPENSTWWMYSGDVLFLREDYSGALERFGRALALEPCHWRAHRFASDTHHRLGDLPSTYRSALLSVVCNPTYENGWDYLGQTMTNYGGELRRLSADWPAGPQVSPSGEVVVNLAPPVEGDEEASRESALMMVYGLARVPIDDEALGLSALQVEERAVTLGLDFLGEEVFTATYGRPLMRAWQLLARAQADGYLPEAILMLRLDEHLVDDFLAHRDAHMERMLRYTATHLAPLNDDSPIRTDPTYPAVLPELVD